MVSPIIRAAIDNAMKDEETLELDSNQVSTEKRKKKKLVIIRFQLSPSRFLGKACLEMRISITVTTHRSLVWN